MAASLARLKMVMSEMVNGGYSTRYIFGHFNIEDDFELGVAGAEH
jgi:hypothetical protein